MVKRLSSELLQPEIVFTTASHKTVIVLHKGGIGFQLQPQKGTHFSAQESTK